jgi:transcriptional regulator with XRE-family HTH domain
MRRMMLAMSQEKLGDALGITFQQVQKNEKGTNRIGASRLSQISQILQVPLAFFFAGAPTLPGERSAEVPRDIPILDTQGVVRLLQLEIELAGSQTAWAKKARVQRTIVNKIVNGQMPPTLGIIKALGLRKVYTTREDF